jgi:hypothetical protein|tara:strand:+ start:2620 stop:2829 length:210 start_codon:yes stop_codon:yes gene_type:complete
MLVDYKNRKINVGDKVSVQRNIQSVDGMLYKDSLVKVDEFEENKGIRVIDNLGKIWWVNPSDVSASYRN